ncbi:MAG: hypothetical protein ACLFQK_02545 [Fibrobacterota bacterium]
MAGFSFHTVYILYAAAVLFFIFLFIPFKFILRINTVGGIDLIIKSGFTLLRLKKNTEKSFIQFLFLKIRLRSHKKEKKESAPAEKIKKENKTGPKRKIPLKTIAADFRFSANALYAVKEFSMTFFKKFLPERLFFCLGYYAGSPAITGWISGLTNSASALINRRIPSGNYYFTAAPDFANRKNTLFAEYETKLTAAGLLFPFIMLIIRFPKYKTFKYFILKIPQPASRKC